MDFLSRLFLRLIADNKKRKRWRVFTTALAGIVVFATAYGLILPAITVAVEEADEIPGIYLEDVAGDGTFLEEDVWEDEVYDEFDGIPMEDDAYWEEGGDDAAFEDGNDAGSDGWDDVVFEDGNGADSEGRDDVVFEDEDEEEVDGGEFEAAEPEAPAGIPAVDGFQDDGGSSITELEADTDRGVHVRLSFDSSAMIPEGTELSVHEIDASVEAERPVYQELRDASDEAVSLDFPGWAISDARFFRLELLFDGVEVDTHTGISSDSSVSVEFQFSNQLYGESLKVIHFEKEALEGGNGGALLPLLVDDVVFEGNGGAGVSRVGFEAEDVAAFGFLMGSVAAEGAVETVAEESGEPEPAVESVVEAAAEPEPMVESVVEEAAEPEPAVESVVEEAAEPEPAVESVVEAVAEPESNAESVVEDVAEIDSADYPAQEFHAEAGRVAVHVYAEAGAFPEGTAMDVREVDDEDTISAISEEAEEDESVIKKIHAVEITFHDAAGREIEPRKPVRVEMVSDEVGENEKAVVVHVDDDGNAETLDGVEVVSRDAWAYAEVTDGVEGNSDSADREMEAGAGAAVLDVEQGLPDEGAEAIVFEADEFSIYAIVYTVDFHWEVDGKVYDFSIPGGGFASLEHVVEALGIAKQDVQGDFNNEAADAEDGVEDGREDAPLASGNAAVSDDARKFVRDVDKVEFSNPGLLSVSKADTDTTVGAVKGDLGLVCEYSADLTDAQIAEINAARVEGGDWALISLKAFESTEYLTVTMKNGDSFRIKVTDAQISTHVLTTSGDTYEITVTYGEDAGIPDGAELRAREITEEDEGYDQLQKDVSNLGEGIENIPAHPALFDISILANGQEIEPAGGSEVKVEVKLVKSAVRGLFTDEDSPLLINDAPISDEDVEIEQSIQIIHEIADGELEIIETKDTDTDERYVSEFVTNSFSNYLVFLDQDVKEITVSNGDTITLRPYSQWVWEGQNQVDGAQVSWIEPNVAGHAAVETKTYNDSQLGQEYSYYQITANSNPGEFYIETTAGKKIKVTVRQQPVSAKPSTVSGLDGITVDLFNYDLDKSLDVPQNVASMIDIITEQNGTRHYTNSSYQWVYEPGPYGSDGINAGSALKFLGWGASNGGNRINNYVATAPTTGIVQNTLTGTGDKKYPQLNGNGNTSLEYLFSAGNDDVEAHTGVKGLFQLSADGYYYFNSNTNYAYYVGNDNAFKLYEHTYSQNTGNGVTSKPIGFFPFHDYDSNNDLSPNHNTNLVHHFGLSMAQKFAIPKGGKDDNGNPITFEFSGDDDMWVFISDDETDNLALDLGGIHQPITGKIDFSTIDSGYAVVYVSGQPVKQVPMKAGKEYTLRAFYLERGGCDSNCSIKFNLPIYRTLKLAKRLNGLSEKEFEKYKDEWFTYELNLNGSLYNTPEEAKYTAQNPEYDLRPIVRDGNGNIIGAELNSDGTPKYENGELKTVNLGKAETAANKAQARWMVVTDGQIHIKDNWVVEIPHLSRSDNFYVAEEKTINMDEFEAPHAEREYYTNTDGQLHEEEIGLDPSTSVGENPDEHKQLADWKTGNLTLQETEKITFTNTLKEKNIDVEKQWSDGKEAHIGDSITFRLVAKIPIGDDEGLYTAVHGGNIWGKVTGEVSSNTILDPHEEEVLLQQYTLSAKNDWKMSFEHLPAVTEHDEVITYSVEEVSTTPGYTSAEPTFAESYEVDVFKYFPDDTYPEETITFHLKKDGQYYTGSGWGSKGDAAAYALQKSSVRDESYHCRFKDMPDGTYSIEQVDSTNPLTEGLAIYRRPLKKFTILNEKKITISVKKEWDPAPGASENASVTVELHRYAKKTSGVLSVTLKDNNGAAICGAVFEVYKLNEETQQFEATNTTETTDVNGIVSVGGLAPGKYKLVQKSTPEGYSMEGHTTESDVLTVEDDKVTPQSLNTDLTNTALVTAGIVTLTVTDSGAGSGIADTAVQGAVFTLYKDGAVYDTGYTSDQNGKIVVGNLPAGTYYFMQTAAPEKYKPSSGSPTFFVINEAPGAVQERVVNITNSLKGKGTISLTLKKDDNTAISGASFELKQGDTVLETKATSSDGTLTFETEIYEGSYTVHQVDTGSAGADYSAAADQPVVIDANSITDQHKSLTFTNEEAAGKVTVNLYRTQGTRQGSGQNNNSQGGGTLADTWERVKAGSAIQVKISRKQDGHDMYYCTNYNSSNDWGTWTKITDWQGNDYYLTFNVPQTPAEATYNLAVSSGWSQTDGSAAFVGKPAPDGNGTNRISNPAAKGGKRAGFAGILGDAGITAQNVNAVTHSDASPASAPEGYTEDTTFTPIPLTLSGDNWTGSFPAQDKADAEGNDYFYYVVETNRTPSDYWVDAYEGGTDGLLNNTGTLTIKNKKEETQNTETPTSLTVKKRWLASDGTTDVSNKYADKTIKFDVYQVASVTTQAQSSGDEETRQMLIAVYDKDRSVKYLNDELGHLGNQSKYIDLPVGAEVTAAFTPKDPSVSVTANYLDGVYASGVSATRGNEGNVVTLKFTVDETHSYAYLMNDNLSFPEFDVSISIGTTTVSQPVKYLENVELAKGDDDSWTWAKSDLPGTKTEGDTTTVYKYYIKEVDNGGTDTVVSGLSEVPVTGGEIVIKNVEKPSTPTPQTPKDPVPEIRKYVEKVSGQSSNDDYNLTLTVKSDSEIPSSKLDVLFVVDTTLSMTYQQLDGGQTRSWDGITDAIDYLTKAFDASDVDVQYAMTRFWSYQSNYAPDQPYGDSQVVQQWTNQSSDITGSLNELQLENATNYDAAFYTLKNSGILTRDGDRANTPKLVIFISDGYPNIYYDTNGYDVADSHYVDGRYPDSENAAFARLSQVSGMNGFYALGVSDGVGKEVLDTLITYASAEHKGAFQCNDTQAIKNAFDSILNTYTGSSLKKVRIEDTLSDYAQPAGTGTSSNAAVKITVKDAEGNVVKEAAGTIAAPVTLELDKTQRNGSDTAADRTLTAAYDSSTRQLKLLFPENYELENHWDYQVTMAIEPTLKAYEEYRTNGTYPDTGSKDTDVVAGTKVTSSELPGFKSNKEAKLYYNDKEPISYPDPVIQTLLTGIQLLKVDGNTNNPLEDVKFSLYRQANDDDSKPADQGGTGKTIKEIVVPSGTTTVKVNVVEVSKDALTDADGHITFEKLIPGVYYLEETEPPADYTGIGTLSFTITVGDYNKEAPGDWKLLIPTSGSYKGCTWAWDETGKKYGLTVPNTMTGGYELPSTGGPGAKLFYLLGSILFLGAGVLLWRRRGIY